MSERLTIYNLLLLTLLSGILLASSGLLCAQQCPTERACAPQAAVQTADCHAVFPHPAPVRYCSGKACHQGSAPLSNLGRPEIHNLQEQDYPLASSAQPDSPQCKIAPPLAPPRPTLHSEKMPTVAALAPLLSLREVRTTVLLN